MSRKKALPLASSASSNLVVGIIILMFLSNMQERTTLVTAAMACCGCSTFSAALRMVQYSLHGFIGIKTY